MPCQMDWCSSSSASNTVRGLITHEGREWKSPKIATDVSNTRRIQAEIDKLIIEHVRLTDFHDIVDYIRKW